MCWSSRDKNVDEKDETLLINILFNSFDEKTKLEDILIKDFTKVNIFYTSKTIAKNDVLNDNKICAFFFDTIYNNNSTRKKHRFHLNFELISDSIFLKLIYSRLLLILTIERLHRNAMLNNTSIFTEFSHKNVETRNN